MFDKDKVQKEINLQMDVTKKFGENAPKAVADYASSQAMKLRAQGNEKKKKKTGSTFVKAKKIKVIPSKSDSIITKAKKRGKPKKRVKHVLFLTDNLYITCNSHCYMLCEVRDGVDKNGKPISDSAFLYASNLQDILQIAVKHMIQVPMDVQGVSAKLDSIYELIKERVPLNTKPKDLFKDIVKEDIAE